MTHHQNKIAQVSVIIPCFRCAGTIERAVISVVQQTQKPAEIILIEDGSGDNTLTVLQNLATQYLGWIKVIALPKNQGLANARNIGWAAATQTYIAFLDADDAWHPQKIEIQYAYMETYPEVVLSGHGHRILQDNILPNWELKIGKEKRIPKWSWLLSNKFVPISVMIRQNASFRFIPDRRYMEDHILWLEFVCSGHIVIKLTVELAAIYKKPFGVAGLSSNLWAMEKGELQNYHRLYFKKYINMWQWLGLSLYSSLKFVRRLIIYWGWLRWKI